MMLPIIDSILWGALGGVVYSILWYHSKNEIWDAIKHVILGGIVGLLYSQTGFPDSLNTFAAGYFALDVIEFFITEFRKPKRTEQKEGE
jgi:hypothetical protein